jgi:hypothetical protein
MEKLELPPASQNFYKRIGKAWQSHKKVLPIHGLFISLSLCAKICLFRYFRQIKRQLDLTSSKETLKFPDIPISGLEAVNGTLTELLFSS